MSGEEEAAWWSKEGARSGAACDGCGVGENRRRRTSLSLLQIEVAAVVGKLTSAPGADEMRGGRGGRRRRGRRLGGGGALGGGVRWEEEEGAAARVTRAAFFFRSLPPSLLFLSLAAAESRVAELFTAYVDRKSVV